MARARGSLSAVVDMRRGKRARTSFARGAEEDRSPAGECGDDEVLVVSACQARPDSTRQERSLGQDAYRRIRAR